MSDFINKYPYYVYVTSLVLFLVFLHESIQYYMDLPATQENILDAAKYCENIDDYAVLNNITKGELTKASLKCKQSKEK